MTHPNTIAENRRTDLLALILWGAGALTFGVVMAFSDPANRTFRLTALVVYLLGVAAIIVRRGNHKDDLPSRGTERAWLIANLSWVALVLGQLMDRTWVWISTGVLAALLLAVATLIRAGEPGPGQVNLPGVLATLPFIPRGPTAEQLAVQAQREATARQADEARQQAERGQRTRTGSRPRRKAEARRVSRRRH